MTDEKQKEAIDNIEDKTKTPPPQEIKVSLLETFILPLTFPKASLGKYYYARIKMKNLYHFTNRLLSISKEKYVKVTKSLAQFYN